MNIFYLDKDPKLAAQYQADKHVVKMILESAQILSTVQRLLKPESELPDWIYKSTHKNHPCTVWARKSLENYDWLCDHAVALCNEYTYRYNKYHKSRKIINYCIDNPPKIQSSGFTTPALAMPDELRCGDPVVAYREYYKVKRETIDMRWTIRDIPEWI